jgi:hypothetical protein
MQDELGEIARDLLADLERARPGFPVDPVGFAKAAGARMRLRLTDLRAQFASVGSDQDYERVARELEEVLLGRYVIFAQAQGERERRGGGGWRGGDVVSRIVLSLVGLSVGGFLVWAPFIPIWEKSVPFISMLVAPTIPDMQRWWFARQHALHLQALCRDMAAAGRALQDSQPLAGLSTGDRGIDDGGRRAALVSEQRQATVSKKEG